jgi:hypothetical protein
MVYITRNDLNEAFYAQAELKDDEAKDFLRLAGDTKRQGKLRGFLVCIPTESIKRAQAFIDDNYQKISNLNSNMDIDPIGNLAPKRKSEKNGFQRLKNAYYVLNKNSRIKELTLESQYIQFHDLNIMYYPSEFSQNTYNHANFLMSLWK